MKNDPTFWERRLAGEVLPIHDGCPAYGFYRVRGKNTWLPVTYWYDDDGSLCCLRDGTLLDEQIANEMWPRASKNPITYEVYKLISNGGEWPDLSPAVTRGHNNPPPDASIEALTDAIEDLAREAESIIKTGAAKTQDEANQAGDLANRLGELREKADRAREAEKRPFLEGGRAVDDKWRGVISLADIYKRIKAVVCNPFLDAERRKREAEAAEARRKAEEIARAGNHEAAHEAAAAADVIAARPLKVGTRGRGVSQRTVTKVVIEDRAALLEYVKDFQEVTDLLQTLAEKVVRAGVTPLGVKTHKETIAA